MEYETALIVVAVLTSFVSLGKLGEMFARFDSGEVLTKNVEYYLCKFGVFLLWFFTYNLLYIVSGIAMMFLVASFYEQL